MPPVDTRDVLSPYVGRVVRCRGTVMKDERCRQKHRTLVTDLYAKVRTDWFYAADHCWVFELPLCSQYGTGAVVEFDARVRQYSTGAAVRYTVAHPRNVVRVAASLDETVAWLVREFGWGQVADAVERLHTHGEQT